MTAANVHDSQKFEKRQGQPGVWHVHLQLYVLGKHTGSCDVDRPEHGGELHLCRSDSACALHHHRQCVGAAGPRNWNRPVSQIAV
jgi:hypothetical protein